MRVRMTTITMIYYNTEKKSTIPWGKLTSFLKKLHTVTVTPQQDNHFRKQIVYLKMSLCILVKDKVSTPHIVVITAHCHKGYKLLTGRSMVWWITRALQEYCLLLFFCFVFLLFFLLIIVTTTLPRWISGRPSHSCGNCFVIQLHSTKLCQNVLAVKYHPLLMTQEWGDLKIILIVDLICV